MAKKVERRVPNLRFKGFTDDWEQRKFKNSVSRITKHDNNSDLPHIEFENINSGLGSLKNKISELHTNKTGIFFQKNDILFGKLRPYLKNWYFANFNGIAVGDFWVLRSDNMYPQFLYYLIQTEKFYSISNLSSGSKMPRSDWNLVSNYKFQFPQQIQESVKIGQLLAMVDKLLSLQQRKLELLKQLKKGFLQKMFAGSKSKKPLIRIQDFSNEWEERRLGTLAQIVGGGTPNTKNPKYWNGSINWYAPAELYNGQIYTSHSKRSITELGLQNCSAKILPVGTLLFTSRAGIGKTAILLQEATTNQGFQSIVPKKDELDSYFAFLLTNQLKKYGETHGAGSTFIEISGKELSKAPIKLPLIQEQKRISQFNQRLDRIVSCQQIIINNLANLKKFLLQQMFI